MVAETNGIYLDYPEVKDLMRIVLSLINIRLP
jgi:hypothetical protein